MRGVVGEIATENSARNPKRTATTALALMIGVTLVVAASVIASSVKESIRGDLEAGLNAELVVEAGAGREGGMSPELTATLGELDAVDAVSPVRPLSGTIDEEAVSVSAVYSDQLADLVDLEVIEGDLGRLEDDGIAVGSQQAERRDLGLGDNVEFVIGTETVNLEVVAIFDNNEVAGDLVVDAAISDLATGQILDPLVLINTDDSALATTQLETALAGDPTAEVLTADSYIDDQAGTLDTLLNILYGLLALSVVIALLGVTNTMSLSIYETHARARTHASRRHDRATTAISSPL